MKKAAILAFLCSASGVYGQQQSAQPQLACRDLSTSGNVVFPNETLVDGRACHIVGSKETSAPPLAPAPAPTPAAAQAKAAPAQTAPSPSVAAAASPAAASAPADLASMRINGGSTVFIAPMDGFESYMAAALRRKDVPLMPIGEQNKANYILRGSSEEKKGSWTQTVSLGQIHSGESATVQLIDRRTGAIVFTYAVDKKNTLHGQQTVADACAKHLKDAIEKQ